MAAQDEEELVRAVALQNAQSILAARRRAEEALRKQSEWLRVTLSCIGDAVISTDVEGRVTFLNGVAEALTGWPLTEALGLPLPNVFHIVNERTRQPVEDPASRTLREGAIVGLANHTVLIARDGTERPIDDSAAPMRDEGGATIGAVVVFRDVTDRRRAEEARAQLAAIVASSDDAIVSKTLDGVIRSWNIGAERLFGYTAEEALGRPITLIIPPERLDEERVILERLRRGERVDHFETVRLAKDGRRLDISLRISPLRDDEGQVIGASKVARDITERKRAEQERRRLQEQVEAERSRLAEAFQRAPSFLAILRGPQHVFELANDRYYQFVGQRDLIDRPVREALPEFEGQALIELLDRVYRSGEAFAATDMRVVVQREPGRPLEERFVEFVFQPLRAADGSVSGILTQGIDLTDRKRAEAAVRERDERLRLFLENATDYAFIMTDPMGLTLVWEGGAEAITGWRAEEIVGKPASVLFSPVERAAGMPEAEMGEAARAGRALDQRWHVRKDGSRFFADGVMVSLRGPAGELRGFGKIFRDATEQKRIEEALREAKREAEEANHAKTQFLAVLSHELRTPLNPILLAVTAMLERPEDPEQLRSTLEVIRHNVNIQARLIDDLLDVMRIVRGKMPLHWEVADGHRLIEQAIQVCRSEILGKTIRIEADLAAGEHHVNADSARLQQVFWNLIKNAVKFTPEGGSIAIRTYNEGNTREGTGRLVIEISDTGIGIEPEVLPMIFDPFQQGETTITRKYGGLGLGLAICQGIMEAHGGTLGAESAGKDRGATFRVRLRALPEPAGEGHGKPVAAAREPRMTSPSHQRILVVEDEPATRRLMARLLNGLGHEVTTADTIARALAAVEAEEFDLIVSDIGLPDGSGLDLMRRVVSRRGPVPAIALTGYGMEEDVRRSREAGFTAHLTKPIDFNKLEAMIRQVAH